MKIVINKKKILTLFVAVSFLMCAFTLSVFATTSRGPSYDESHVENGCCTVGSGSDAYNHYEQGYDDGYYDGYNDGQESQQETIDSMQATIDSLRGDNAEDNEPGDENDNSGSGGDSGTTDSSNSGDNSDDENDDSGSSSGGIGEGDETDEPTDEEAYINYWKQKYLSLYEDYDALLTLCAEYRIYFAEANNRIEALGGEKVVDPLEGDLGSFTFTMTEAERQLAIAEYLQSEAFLAQQDQMIIVAVSDFKSSDEYKDTLTAQYNLGTLVATEEMYNSAYAAAYDAVYGLGVSEGYANYMSTDQYATTIKLCQDGAYEQGYLDGYDFGYVNSTSTEYDLTSLISLSVGFVGLIAVLLLIVNVQKKKRKNRR